MPFFLPFSDTSVPSTSPVDSSTFERGSSSDEKGAQSVLNLDHRIDKTLEKLRSLIPIAVESVEKDIAVLNRDRVIIALANFLGSKFVVEFYLMDFN